MSNIKPLRALLARIKDFRKQTKKLISYNYRRYLQRLFEKLKVEHKKFWSFHSIKSGAIIGDGDRNELCFTIARATPCQVRFGLFLAQITSSLQNKKRALHANLRLDLDKLAGTKHFQMPVLLTDRGTMIYKILMLLLQSSFSLPAHHFRFG